MICWSILMPRCVLSLSTSVWTSFCGTTRSASPWTIRPEDGQGARKVKSCRLAGGAIEMKPSISGRRIRSCMPIQAPKEKPATQQLLRVGVHRLHPVERGGGVGELARAVVERALAPADAAEVEAEHGEAALREHIEELVDDLVVHRPAELRMRMKDDGDRAVLLLGRLETPFEAAGRAGEDHFWHRALSSFLCAAATAGRALRAAGRLKPDPSDLRPPPLDRAGGAAAFISRSAGSNSSS